MDNIGAKLAQMEELWPIMPPNSNNLSDFDNFRHKKRCFFASPSIVSVICTKCSTMISCPEMKFLHSGQKIHKHTLILTISYFFSYYEMKFLHFQSALDEATEPWGIKVERVEMWVPHTYPILLCLKNWPVFWHSVRTAKSSKKKTQ